MPKLSIEKARERAEEILEESKKRTINDYPTKKLKLSKNQKDLLKHLDEMSKFAELKQSKQIESAINGLFKNEIKRVCIDLLRKNKLFYACRDLSVVVIDKIGRSVKIPFDNFVKNYFWCTIWQMFETFQDFINKKLMNMHSVNFLIIYGIMYKTWSPILSNELEKLLEEFFAACGGFKDYELLFYLLCMRLNEFVLGFNKKNQNTKPFPFGDFLLRKNELDQINSLIKKIKEGIMMEFPDYAELYEKYLKPKQEADKFIKKLTGKK